MRAGPIVGMAPGAHPSAGSGAVSLRPDRTANEADCGPLHSANGEMT